VVKKIRIRIRDPNPDSGMNNTDHIFESFETIFSVKMLELFDADPG
jgi:hypothetical protein